MLKAAAIKGIERYGAGSGASRLICGSLAPHHELEQAIAAFKGAEAALANSFPAPSPGTGFPALNGLSATLRISDAIFEPMAARLGDGTAGGVGETRSYAARKTAATARVGNFAGVPLRRCGARKRRPRSSRRFPSSAR